jgi:hypothetical protein
VADAELGAGAVVGAGVVEALSDDEPQAPTGTTVAMIAATAARRNNGDVVSGIGKLLRAQSSRPSPPQLTLASVRVGNQLSDAATAGRSASRDHRCRRRYRGHGVRRPGGRRCDPEVQQAAIDSSHYFYSLNPQDRRAYSEQRATNFAAPMTLAWPNWAKVFFNNKGVATKETDNCTNYPLDDQSVWDG